MVDFESLCSNATTYDFNVYFQHVNAEDGKGLQTFYPSTLSVLYNKDVYQTSSIV